MYKSYWRESIQSGSKLCENRGKTDHKRHELQWEEENYHVSNIWSHGQFCGVSLNLCGSLDCAMSCKSKDSIHHDLLQNRPACFQKFIRLTFKHDLNMCTQLYLEILSKQTVCPKGCFGLPGPYSRCLNCQFLMVSVVNFAAFGQLLIIHRAIFVDFQILDFPSWWWSWWINFIDLSAIFWGVKLQCLIIFVA